MGNICNMFNKDTPNFINIDSSNNIPVEIRISYSSEPPPYSSIDNPIIQYQNQPKIIL